MSRIVDYTKMRRNSMICNAYIAVCPKCKQKGLRLVSEPQNGKQKITFMHEAVRTLNGVEMTEGCEVVNEIAN